MLSVELRHLRAFVAVAEELHFGRASQRLHLAQPAVTRTIQQLEVRLGEQLFERDKRHVALTGAGEALFVHATGMLERANLVTAAVRGAAGTAARQLTVGTVTHAPFGELTFPILNAFRQAAPETPLSMRELGFNEMDALALGSVDMLFTVQPWEDENIAWTPLALDPTVGMMSTRHPLAETIELKAADLLDEPLPSPPPGMPAGFVEGHTLPEHRNGEPATFAYSHPYRTAMEFADLIAAGSFWSPASLLVARRTVHAGVIYLPIADVAPMAIAVGIPAHGANETARRLVGVAQRVAGELIDLLPGAKLIKTP